MSVLMMSHRQYDTHGFDRQRYQAPMQPVYLEDYARALPLTLSYAERPQMRSAPIAAPIERHQLESDQDSGSNPQNRRRIAVACARCRKRKIKCSGDPGNGSGCQNCRAAGSESCTFFRVGSFAAQAEQSRSFDASQGMAVLAHAASNFQQQEYPTRAQFPLRLTTNLSAAYPSYHECESPVENYGLGPSNTIANHEPYGPVYQVHDGNGRAYLTQASYNPPTYSESPVQEALAAAGYSHSSASYVDTNGARQQVITDAHGVFSVGSLQHSLPTPTTDRKLPIPAQNHRSYYADDMLRPRTSSGTTSQHYTMASAGYTRQPPTNWSTEHLPHGLPSRSSTAALNSDLMAPPTSTTSISTPSAASEINSVSYAASASSSEDSPAEVEPVEQDSHVAPERAPTRSSTATGPARSLYNIPAASSSEIILPRAGGLYTFSSDSERNHMGESSSGTLVTGDPYEPIKQHHSLNSLMVSVPYHYPPLQPAPTSATRYTLPPHPNLEASSDGPRTHQLQRRPSIPSTSNS